MSETPKEMAEKIALLFGQLACEVATLATTCNIASEECLFGMANMFHRHYGMNEEQAVNAVRLSMVCAAGMKGLEMPYDEDEITELIESVFNV